MDDSIGMMPSMSANDRPLSASAPLMASSFRDSSVRPSFLPWTVAWTPVIAAIRRGKVMR